MKTLENIGIALLAIGFAVLILSGAAGIIFAAVQILRTGTAFGVIFGLGIFALFGGALALAAVKAIDIYRTPPESKS